MNTVLFFDLDGTLIDSRADLAAAVNDMRGSFGLDVLPQSKVVSFVGDGIRKLVERSLENTGCDPDEGTARMMRYYSRHLTDCTTLYPGVRTGLAELSAAGFVNIVVTNKNLQASKQILNKLEVLKYFDKVCGADGETPLKPDPTAILESMAEFSGDPERSCVLGDNHTDLEAARRAGLPGIYADYGFGSPKEEKYAFAVSAFADFVQSVMLQKLRDIHQTQP